MIMEPQAPLSGPAAARSALYALFSEAFEYPRGELLEAIRSGALALRLREWLERLAPPLPGTVDWPALADAGDREDALATEYTRLFDPGTSASPCALYGGLHVGPQMMTMEEVLRFYQHFGLGLTGKGGDTPDHLTTQLEFLHVLAYGEAELSARGEDPSSYRLGRRDFIARHPGRWIPMMRARLERQDPMPFYARLVELLERCLAADLAELEAVHGGASVGPGRSAPS